ncbi:MAG TPA: phospholipase D-like domain-containing protein [Dokdonella sp.]|uniref:phospholipase D-like domain-containing protein n=1 Tax=Dokdonella sp. TaxID=2291710 RepID=UPI002B5DA144|nr:phospholipase D-like domain-containing protein [Dokdonella sp.]HUD42209.1 phospholipase D-like domain-containing protein [Dokdonella sp.]
MATPWLSWHALAVIGALLVYVMVTRLRRDRRPPVAAIAWVLALLLAPYLALPLYLIFGGRKQRPVTPRPARSVPADEHWTAAYARGFGLAGPATGAVRFHADSTASLRALIALIGSARSTLDLATFVFAADADGERVAAALIERQHAGVRVRVLIDGAGLLLARRGIVARLRRAGVGVRVFQPPWVPRLGQARNLRNHRKWTIADGERVWMGGRNLAAEYFSSDRGGPPWIDLTFELDGAIGAVVARQFERDWARGGGGAVAAASRGEPAVVAATASDANLAAAGSSARVPRGPAAQTAGPGGSVSADVPADRTGSASIGSGAIASDAGAAGLLFVPSGPDQAEDTVLALLEAACSRARQRIVAVTPYFVPDPGLLQALRLACLRGVTLDLVVPARSNHRIADLARSRALRSLAAAGARIHLSAGMVHAKAIVFDAGLALAGSVNLDTRSLLLNYESMLLIRSPEAIAWLADWILAQAVAAQPYVATEPSLARDVGEGLLLALTFEV